MKRKKQQSNQLYKIWLFGIGDTPGGFYGGPRGMNDYIYSRTNEADAVQYGLDRTIETIAHMKRYGYPCKAVPPIHIPAHTI